MINIRREKKADEFWVEKLTRAAFWKEDRYEKSGLGCDEHYLVHQLRQSEDFIGDLNFIAETEDEIIGNIMYTKAYIKGEDDTKHPVIVFGPISVLPKHQKKGVGGALLRHSMNVAKELGYGAILIYGHPSYYPRFGFQEAKDFNITTESGENFPAFMAYELQEGYLKNIEGKFYLSPVYTMDPQEAKAYDVQFKEA